jgi:hypothetical protein
MKRRVLHILSACCLVLGLLIGGCGVISLRDHRLLRHVRRPSSDEMRVRGVASCDAAIWLSSSWSVRRPGTVFLAPAGWYFGPGSFTTDGRPWARPYYFHHSRGGSDQKTLILPHWLVAVCFVALGLPFIGTLRRHFRSRRRIRNRQCLKCGYDIRFITDRCPECGEMVARHPAGQQAAGRERCAAIVAHGNSISILRLSEGDLRWLRKARAAQRNQE